MAAEVTEGKNSLWFIGCGLEMRFGFVNGFRI